LATPIRSLPKVNIYKVTALSIGGALPIEVLPTRDSICLPIFWRALFGVDHQVSW
jgi:hypothetical protein